LLLAASSQAVQTSQTMAHALTTLGLVDEFWFWVSPSLWATGPRIFDWVGRSAWS
jgi:hypothetical protein